MSPIFNHQALHGLKTSELQLLRETLRQALAQENLSECTRMKLYAALDSIEAALRQRHAPQAPKPSAPSP